MKNVWVSIITVCYNSEKTIERTIKSVLEQTYKSIEYIIIDGASTDRTSNIIHQYEEAFGDRLILVCEPDNGIYDAMNKGIKKASGEVIGIINSDDWYEPDAVEQVVDEYLNQDQKDFMVIYGRTGMIKDGELFKISKSSHDDLEEKMISHPSCFITKKTYDTFGIYDVSYPSVADYDLMLRYKRTGKVNFIPIDAHIANFTLGGMSSTNKAYIDLLRLKMNYKKISRFRGNWEIFKANLAKSMKDHGFEPIRIRKR